MTASNNGGGDDTDPPAEAQQTNVESDPSLPADANEGCVGPTSSTAGKAAACEGCPNQSACASGAYRDSGASSEASQVMAKSLQGISHVILVLSGKGGVGKSTVACQVVQLLAKRGYAAGILDVDICGPSVPTLLGCPRGAEVRKTALGQWSPVMVDEGRVAVMSIGFLMTQPDDAVVWRGPRKNGLISQFLQNVDWGELDYLVIDTPPGTSDEHISTVQYLQQVSFGISLSSIVVTTPEEVSMADVRKELNFCRKTKLPVLGVVENMSCLKMPCDQMQFFHQDQNVTAHIRQLLAAHCPEFPWEALTVQSRALFRTPHSTLESGPQGMAKAFGVPYLGAIPLDPFLGQACEEGRCVLEDASSAATTRIPPSLAILQSIVDAILKTLPVEEVDDQEE